PSSNAGDRLVLLHVGGVREELRRPWSLQPRAHDGDPDGGRRNTDVRRDRVSIRGHRAVRVPDAARHECRPALVHPRVRLRSRGARPKQGSGVTQVTARLLRARFLLLLVAGAAAAIAVLGRGEEPYRIKAEFKDAAGLRKNSNVKIDGVPVGKVSSLAVTDKDTALATLEIDRSTGPIGSNAHVHVRSANILGEKYIDL